MSEKANWYLFIVVVMFCLLQFWPAIPLNSEVIEIKKPTHVECEPKTLKLVKKLPMDFGEEEFFVHTEGFVFDSKNHCYVFDSILSCIYVFDTDFKYSRKWVGKKGQGPGDLGSKQSIGPNLFIDKDDMIYLSDSINNKIMGFNNQFKLKQEVFLKGRIVGNFVPLRDAHGSFYIYSSNDGIVDKIDNKGKVLHTFLDKELLYKFIFREPFLSPKVKMIFGNKVLTPEITNSKYFFLKNGNLIIYLNCSSTFYVFEGKTLKNQFNFWPQMAVESYRAQVKKIRKNDPFFVSMFHRPVLDGDSGASVYLHGIYTDRDCNLLYNVSFQGELLEVINIPRHLANVVVAKKNGLFYCKRNEELSILKL